MSPRPSGRSLHLLGLVLLACSVVQADERPEPKPKPTFTGILESWARAPGGNDAAVVDLLTYITEHPRHLGPMSISREAKIVHELAKDDPGVYVPLISLYTKAHSRALIHQSAPSAVGYLQAEGSRMISQYIAGVDDPSGYRRGSMFLVSLAGSLRDTFAIDDARRLLKDALDIDPTNSYALLAAAAIDEKFGRYSSASKLLEQLLERDELPEAELRLALCRARTQKLDDAERRFARLARGEGLAWIRALAYQEWAQLRMRRGDPRGALALAREGLVAHPEDPSLRILVAFFSGPRDPLSDAVLLGVTSSSPGAGPTPRGMYNLWPVDLARVEPILAREVEAVMPLLAEALREHGESESPERSRTP